MYGEVLINKAIDEHLVVLFEQCYAFNNLVLMQIWGKGKGGGVSSLKIAFTFLKRLYYFYYFSRREVLSSWLILWNFCFIHATDEVTPLKIWIFWSNSYKIVCNSFTLEEGQIKGGNVFVHMREKCSVMFYYVMLLIELRFFIKHIRISIRRYSWCNHLLKGTLMQIWKSPHIFKWAIF